MNVARELKPNQELRFQVGEEPIKLELRRGLAEVYGAEMLSNRTYTFPRNSRAAVFTYQGALIEMTGTPLKCHVGQMCDYMLFYLKIHGQLEMMRDEAERYSEQLMFRSSEQPGSQPTNDNNAEAGEPMKPDLSKTPICLVCKPPEVKNVGKSTLCRILLNYAARRGRAPIFVDLDPDQNLIGLPGTIGALSIESPIDIELGMSLKSSMLMHFGCTEARGPSVDPSNPNRGSSSLYKLLVENMAKIVHSKLEQDKKSYYSGVIINASSWDDDSENKMLIHACKAFKANMVLAMDDEGLQYELKSSLSSFPYPVDVLLTPKTVGIVTRVSALKVELRYNRIKEYFYGTPQEALSPFTSEVKFSNLKRLIYKVGNPVILQGSMLPLGTNLEDIQLKVSPYDCTASDLLHHILAISHCKIDEILEDSQLALRTNIMGFVCVTSVRSDGETMSVLSPQKLPSPMDYVLLFSNVQYMDSLI